MSTTTATHKACTKCSNIKPLDDFAANASNADGKQRHCRECMKNMRGKQAGQHAPAGGILLSMSVAVIVASLTNPRKTFDAQRLAELADSIKETGLRQPILVRPLPANRIEETSQAPAPLPADSKKWARPTHEIIAGERRFRAAQLAGLTIVPVVVTAMTDEQVLTFQLVENLQREDLHPMEEAEGYQRLCERTGISKDEIGDKIGKSRSYVYQRLKLLNLSAAAREAFGKGMPGGIDMSRALVIARCPDTQLQQKALEYAVKADWQGEVPSVRAFQAWARQNIMLQLDSARFKITAVDLVPDAGSCRECPNRTGANPDLFADVQSADVCTDPKCFHAKEAAHDAAILAKAAERGQRVIEEKEAKGLWQHEHSDINGYVRLDKPDYRVDSRKNLKSVLGKDIPEPILMANPHKGGELVEVLPRATVSDLLLERGKITAQQVRGDRVISESEAKMKALDKFERTWRKRAIAAVSEEMEKFGHAPDLWPGVLRVLALELVGGLRQDERALVADLLGLGKVAQADGIRDHLKNADALQAQEAMCILLMHHDLVNVLGYDHKVHPADRIGAVADMYQVDVKVIQAAVKAEMKDEAAAKAEKAKKSSVPAAPGGSKSEVKGKKGAAKKPPAPKTSAAEARESIAAALQAVDGGQDQAPTGAELTQGDALASPVQAADAADLDKPAALAAGAASPVAWPFPGPTLKPGVAARVAAAQKASQGGEPT